jgi:hypothetical protein
MQGSLVTSPIGFVRVIDSIGGTSSYNTVATTGGVFIAADDRLTVAVNTRETSLLTERAPVTRHVDGPIYASDDRAATWTNIGGPQAAMSMAINQQRDELFVANTPYTYRSPDGGLTWFRETFGPYFAIDPRDPTIQWYSTGTGATRRRVSGGTWATAGAALTSAPNATFVLAVNPLDSNVWVGGDFGVEVVSSSGREFRMENSGLPQRTTVFGSSQAPVRSFAFDPRNANVIYAGTDEGLCVRQAGSTAWTVVTSQIIGSDRAVRAVAVDPNDARTVLIGRND